jgi:hypothetical protein
MAAQFPTRRNPAHLSEPIGPDHLILRDLVPEYSVTIKEFKDKGRSYGQINTANAQRWELIYNGLTAAQAATLDAHYVDAQGQFESFSFRHPRTSVLHTDVHYESFERSHEKIWSQSVRIVLVKTPA